MDRATRRYRAAMIKPGSRGLCRYCDHSVDVVHVGAWCATCYASGTECEAAEVMKRRRA